MKDLPHRYQLDARAQASGNVALASPGLPPLESAPPVEFDGPGGLWSPETLLLAALADCYVLSFRVLAANSKLAWNDLQCHAEGVVDRADGAIRFTEIHLRAQLVLPPDQKRDRAERLLQRAEKACIISSSLATPVHVDIEIREATAAG